jgi:hypothetical protein
MYKLVRQTEGWTNQQDEKLVRQTDGWTNQQDENNMVTTECIYGFLFSR